MQNMGIFGRKLPPIEVGDRFMKTGDRVGKVWEVSRLEAGILKERAA
jgi:hypothetical protein